MDYFKYSILSLTLCLTACNSDNNPQQSTTDDQPDAVAQIDNDLRTIINDNNLTGDAFTERNIPDINSDIAQLGKHLFFSKSLSGDRDTACVACHHPMLGGGDNLSLSIGVGAQLPDLLGLGRLHSSSAEHYDGGPPVPRNAPTTFNIGGWDQTIFHDGRIESLGKTPNFGGSDGIGIRTPNSTLGIADPFAGSSLTHAQARFPITSNEEMKGFNYLDKDAQGIREYLASRLGGYGEGGNDLPQTQFWVEKFQTAFMQPTATPEQVVTEQNIAFALGQYELSQVFVNNPWRDYVQGDDDAISESAKRGAKLFYQNADQGGANCASCHSGDFFTDEQFHNMAAPQIGRGKGDGDSHQDDFGRFRETQMTQDMYRFRTPTLLNVAVTGPWLHSGAYTDLEGVVRHSLNPQAAIENYDPSQLTQPGMQNIENILTFGQNAINSDSFNHVAFDFSDEQVSDLVAFLHALTDPCVLDRICMSPWIAQDDENQDPNGDQLNAVDIDGVAL